ncbi:MAG TPA: zonular occludens toxin domain-containing protein, partial [Herpetosiphonaceae bacterium]
MRAYLKEILGFAIAGIIVWVLLGGDLPGIWVADARSSVSGSPSNPPASVVEPERPEVSFADEQQAPLGAAPSTTRQPMSTDSSGAARIITIITGALAVLVSAFGIALLVVWWMGRRRLAMQSTSVVTPEGVIVEVSAQPLHQPARPAPVPQHPRSAPRARPRASERPQLPAPRLTVEEATPVQPGAAWTVLAPDLVLRLQQRLGWTPADDDLVPNREKRILELQAKFGASTARVAPNHSLAIFPNVLIPLDELQRKAAPQPAVLTIDDQGTPVAVVGLFYTDRLGTTERQPVSEGAPAKTVSTTALSPATAPVQEPTWDSIARPARISKDLPLAIDAFLSEIFVIAGRRRTGKSYTLGVVLEELCRYRFPLAVVDLEGEAYGLRAQFPILIVGRSSTTEVDLLVAPAAAFALAQWAHQQGQQLILDLSDYGRDEQIAFVTAFAEGLWDAAKSAEPRRRFALVIDEAHELYPQKQPTAASEILDRLVLRGGKWGITMGFATQRPANLHINARTQAGLAFLHLVEQARDIAAY